MAESAEEIVNTALLYIGHSTPIDDLQSDTDNAAVVANRVYTKTRDELLRAYGWPRATRRARLTLVGGAVWASGTTYAAQAGVTYNGHTYLALQSGNTGNQPDISPTWWRQVDRDGWAYTYVLPNDVITALYLWSGVLSPRIDQDPQFSLEDDDQLGTLLLTNWGGMTTPALALNPTPPPTVLVYVSNLLDVQNYSPDFEDALAWKLAIKLGAGLRKDRQTVLDARAGYQAALAEAMANARRESMPPDASMLPPEHIAGRW